MFTPTEFQDVHVGGYVQMPVSHNGVTAGAVLRVSETCEGYRYPVASFFAFTTDGREVFFLGFEWDWTIPYLDEA